MSTSDVVGNTIAKQQLLDWAKAHPTACLLSGPVGVGKTSVASAVLRDTGHIVVDVCAKPEDFTALMDDVVKTPPQKPVGVVVDEVDNLTQPHRTFLVKLLTRHASTLQVHVICVCNDSTDNKMKSLMKACVYHVRMFTPTNHDVGTLIRNVSPKLQLTVSKSQMQLVAQIARGDMRRCVMALLEMKHTNTTHIDASDVLKLNPFVATQTVLRARTIESGVQAAASNDSDLVKWMSAKHVPSVVPDIHALSERLAAISCADVMSSHPSYAVTQHALYLHVGACSRTSQNIRNISFPTRELTLHSTRNSRRSTMKQVMDTCGTRNDVFTWDALRHRRDVLNAHRVSKDLLKRVERDFNFSK
jgi:hypothetical protein